MELNALQQPEASLSALENSANNNLEDVERLSDDEDDLANSLSRAKLSLTGTEVDDATNDVANDNESASARRHSHSSSASSADTKPLRSSSEFMATRNGALEVAAQLCKPVLCKNVDGALLGFWLLTE